MYVCVRMCVSLSALTVSVFADRVQALLVLGWHPSIEACSAQQSLCSHAVFLFSITVNTRPLLPHWHQSHIKESRLSKTNCFIPSCRLTGLSLAPLAPCELYVARLGLHKVRVNFSPQPAGAYWSEHCVSCVNLLCVISGMLCLKDSVLQLTSCLNEYPTVGT